ncbi:thioredoxin family protein [Terribacillus saccharophilus]|uniref:thioredoxin family protein n=1 Tax=Terribacillus saccharophilus TaxID=361277 RepID=UPI000BA679D1|nr:thioredoxin family protein [Terribacillus saccharophilus]PAF22912.1 thioredoxin family protein [Terribacillus saccharophilus]
MTTLYEWFEKGINIDAYLDSMQTHKENTMHIYDHYELPADTEFFNTLRTQKLRAIVLTEDWCGDAMLNLPIFYHIAQAGAIDVRILHRDENLELMDQYLTNGKSRSIPIIIFINQNGDEVAKWGPRAPELQVYIDESFSNLPDKDAPEYEEKRNQMLTFITKSYRDNTDFWQRVYASLKRGLEEA